jgi:hypothetical protein
MNAIKILRQLWHRWRLLAVVAAIAVLAGMAVMYKLPSLKSRSYDVSVATGQILLDTPNSQVVALSPKGSDTLGYRANLIASLMVGSTVESAIAQQAGLHPSQLSGTTDAAALAGTYGGSPPVSSEVPSGPNAYILTTNTLTDLANDPLPIIEFSAQALNPAAAMRLANATIAGLRDYLATKAAAERIPDAGRVQINSVGVPQITTRSHGPTAMIALLAAILVLALGCAAIVGFPVLARSWRAAEAFEGHKGDAAAAADSDGALQPALGVSQASRGSVRGAVAEVPAADALSNGAAAGMSEDRVVPGRWPRLRAKPDTLHNDAEPSPTFPQSAAGPADERTDGGLGETQPPSVPEVESAGGRGASLPAELAAAREERERAKRERSKRHAAKSAL